MSVETDGFKPNDLVTYNNKSLDDIYIIDYITTDRITDTAYLLKLADGTDYGLVDLWLLTRLTPERGKELCRSLTAQLQTVMEYTMDRMGDSE